MRQALLGLSSMRSEHYCPEVAHLLAVLARKVLGCDPVQQLYWILMEQQKSAPS